MNKEPTREFVALVAFLTSFVALAIDAMLPALPAIAGDLGAAHPNDRQLVVSAIFLGMAGAQLFYGPLSDSFGRRPMILLGLAVFMVGTAVSLSATSFNVMLLGRVLQGVGAAGPRTVSMALVRDLYEGRAMARVMSLSMALFILVPMIAPALGQGIMLLAPWRAIFVLFLVLAVTAFAWFWARQEETHPPSRRIPFSIATIGKSAIDILRNRQTLGYTLAGGVVFGAFIGYLNSSQQILQETYATGKLFPLAFAALSGAIGGASLVNAKLVMRHGMRRLSDLALAGVIGLSALFLVACAFTAGVPPFWLFMIYMLMLFFCIGIMFGNYNALAMEPQGEHAGLASAVVASITTFMAMAGGTVIGRLYDGTMVPITVSFVSLGVAAYLVTRWANADARRSSGDRAA
jgi:DHA1 family bicyclomycin/chloramphenicol resistance-like MFS transporter